jgi:hypothetical protein
MNRGCPDAGGEIPLVLLLTGLELCKDYSLDVDLDWYSSLVMFIILMGWETAAVSEASVEQAFHVY